MELSRVMPGAERSLRETLRWATAGSHARLDALFEEIVDPSRKPVYDAFVRMNHACHRQIEPILASSPLAHRGLAPASRLGALERDMTQMALEPLTLPDFSVPAPNLHEAAGIAYVLEGSRLGATFIERRLREAAGRGEGDRPRHYLAESAHAAEFRTFMDRLARLEWDPTSLDAAAHAANATFDRFTLAARLAGVGA